MRTPTAPHTDPDRLPARLGYKRREFCRSLGISMNTLDRWVRAGHVRTVKVGGTVFIPADEARRIMEVRDRPNPTD